MVLKTQLCRFSGLRIYPGRGTIFVRTDGQVYTFLSKKCKRLHNQKKRPAKIAWTVAYRRAHKKDQTNAVTRRKRRGTGKAAHRAIVGASIEVLRAKRNEKSEDRKAARDKAIQEIKQRKAKGGKK
ncbi:unnamed protein product [Pedinophyceae sp. YPF-701]|nr:unnamed protein product [Pedinophyceae sp. YPF-701]